MRDLLRKVLRWDSILFQLVEVYAGIFEQGYSIICFFVLGKIKLEVKLPCTDWRGYIALRIRKSNTNLNYV